MFLSNETVEPRQMVAFITALSVHRRCLINVRIWEVSEPDISSWAEASRGDRIVSSLIGRVHQRYTEKWT